MKVAIATINNEVAEHFGRCPQYTIFTVVSNKIEEKQVIDNPGHQPGFLPKFLATKGVNVIIAGGMGPRAQGLFNQHGIETLIGCQGEVDQVVKQYSLGDLAEGESACEHASEDHECAH